MFGVSLDSYVLRHLELQSETWYSGWIGRMQMQHSLKELGPNVNISDPTLWLLRREYHKFKANLGKTLSQKKREISGGQSPSEWHSLVCKSQGRAVW